MGDRKQRSGLVDEMVSPQPAGQDSDGARDRAIGALLGLACGDAVGTTLEFKAPGSFTPIDDMVGGGPFGLEPGEWTDDTSMALCLAESLLDRGTSDPADQMRRYLMWSRTGYLSSNGRCFDIGNTVSAQLARFEQTGEAIDPNPHPERAANGSLMRLAAVPIRWHRDVGEAAARSGDSSRTTHGAARPVDACRLMGAMVAALIGGAPADQVFAPGFWCWGELDPAIDAVARGSWLAKAADDIRGRGYCVDALEAAIWAVAGASDHRDAVLRAANLGDDADTTAAIAGQLAGARWGASAIPTRWRDTVVLRDRIEALASGLYRAGLDPRPDDESWPHDDVLHAWWVGPGVLAGEYPGHTSPARARTKIDLLADAGVRTFVDLTTDGELVEYAPIVAEVATARQLDLQHVRCPIPDFGVIDDAGYDRIVGLIAEARRRGVAFVHCWGGVGRTGTVAGCVLLHDGDDGGDVVARLAQRRAGTRKADRPCPESPDQLAVLRRRSGRRGDQR
ncbi:MAG: ADP-ribosylglycohydrolase family protein [Acidimicrobiales bacterium]|nr:ADP-ribosylglycohydrolase family protein [Acidimicrobiales bacterium]